MSSVLSCPSDSDGEVVPDVVSERRREERDRIRRLAALKPQRFSLCLARSGVECCPCLQHELIYRECIILMKDELEIKSGQ